MTEKAAVFITPMVQAIRREFLPKTNTRRIVKGVPANCDTVRNAEMGPGNEWWDFSKWGKPGATRLRSRWKVGDILAVKESAWMLCRAVPDGETRMGRQKWRYEAIKGAPIHYVADGATKPTTPTEPGQVWRLKIPRFLPAWAVRTRVEVTAVRCERVGEISESDAMAEGIVYHDHPRLGIGYSLSPNDPPAMWYCYAKPAFGKLWDSIHRKADESFAASPFVFAYTFRRFAP